MFLVVLGRSESESELDGDDELEADVIVKAQERDRINEIYKGHNYVTAYNYGVVTASLRKLASQPHTHNRSIM